MMQLLAEKRLQSKMTACIRWIYVENLDLIAQIWSKRSKRRSVRHWCLDVYFWAVFLHHNGLERILKRMKLNH